MIILGISFEMQRLSTAVKSALTGVSYLFFHNLFTIFNMSLQPPKINSAKFIHQD